MFKASMYVSTAQHGGSPFRRAKGAETLSNLGPVEILNMTRAYAKLTWAMRVASEASTEKWDESYSSVSFSNPFNAFTKNLWRTESEPGAPRDVLAERRRTAS